MIDISAAGLQFRGAPVTLISERVAALFRRCGQSAETGIGLILRTAEDIEDCGTDVDNWLRRPYRSKIASTS